MDEPDPVVILITFPSDGDVTAFATALVRDREAACVSVLPEVESVYRWEGAIEQARERQLIVKTTVDRVDSLRRRVGNLHPYDTPEFLVLRVAGGEEAVSGVDPGRHGVQTLAGDRRQKSEDRRGLTARSSVFYSGPCHKYGHAPRASRSTPRTPRKARGGSIPAVFDPAEPQA